MNEVIYLVKGPEKYLEQITKEVNKESIMTLGEFLDVLKETNKNEESINLKEVLICRSEEFAMLNYGFIDAWPALIKGLIKKGVFSKVFLHNPPTGVEKLTKKLFSKEQLKESKFKYRSVNYGHLEAIKEKYNDIVIGQPNVLTRLLVYLYPLTKRKYQKPVVLLLYGPAGVGKTETAKFVNSILSKKDSIFRTQLSMHQTNDFASYLFGDDIHKSSLALDLMNRESNILLFDEFDKCPSYLYNAFYQMFDEGIFIDKNHTVNLDKTIIMCTTNYKSESEIIEKLGEAMYSRFDGFIQYQNLDNESKVKIIEREYEEICNEMLNSEEQCILEEEKTLLTLKKDVIKMTNVRNIKNYVMNSISYKIISSKMNL